MIYFDHAASTRIPDYVWDVMREANDEYGNVHRGIHRYAEKTTERFETARSKVANFINADPDEVVFTSGTTASINMVARGLERYIKPDDEIAVTEMEHHSNLIPWQELANRTGATLISIPFDEKGDIPNVSNYLSDRTRILAFPVVSNVLGTHNPVGHFVKVAAERGAITVADAAQSVAHIPTDVKQMGVDFLAFSGHKMYGPTGVGVLYGRRDQLKMLEPMCYGGGMVSNVTQRSCVYPINHRMHEAGTPPILQAIGLGAATDYIRFEKGWHKIRAIENDLLMYARHWLSAHKIKTLGQSKYCGPLVSFNVDDVHPHDVAAILDESGIAVRAGHHCAQPLHTQLGLKASVRASFNFTNMASEIDAMIQVLLRIPDFLRRRNS
jgi:cysteine desulfurase/selenocysteine lyase